LNGNAPIFPQTFGPLSNYTGVTQVNWEKNLFHFPYLNYFEIFALF
jgi:hypothetical protein